MIVGIVLHPYAEKKGAGLGEYIFDLTRSLVEHDTHNRYIIYIKKGLPHPAFQGNNWKVCEVGGGVFWRDIGLRFADPADLYVFNTPILPVFFRKKSIVIALDFAYWQLRTTGLRARLRRRILYALNSSALRRAHTVVAISESTKQDVGRLFKGARDKTHVVYPGFKNICQLYPETSGPTGVGNTPFLLFVGVIKERKNVFNVVKAYTEAKRNAHIPQKLIIAGKGGGEYLNAVQKFVSDNRMEQDIVFTGYVTEAELSWLYRHADALVFPSRVEGFGFPLLEAMSCGTPVLTSTTTSLREVGRDAALLVNPDSVEDIAQGMTKLGLSREVREQLRQQGSARAQEFSWQTCASEFYKLFEHIDHESPRH